jgi:predicted metal-dependent hydrolase
LNFQEHEVEFIYNPRLKNSYIRISKDNTITVKSPFKSKKYTLALLEDKKAWIEKQIEKNNKREKVFVNIEDEVLLFGEIYSIDAPEATQLRKKLHRLKSLEKEKILKAYDLFYKECAKEYLAQELQKYAVIMQLSFNELKIRKMRRRWGSCNSRGVITLNSELMKLDREFIRYVVIHELAHLVHMNHSKEFHALVEKYLPNSKQIRKRLKESRVLD